MVSSRGEFLPTVSCYLRTGMAAGAQKRQSLPVIKILAGNKNYLAKN